jgi:hypothetical protein
MQHANDPTAPIATRVPMPEHFSSEPDNTVFYIPKSVQGQTSFQKTGFVIPQNVDGPVLNHMRVALCTSAIPADRQRSLDQLRRMCAAGDERAQAALDAMNGLVIEEQGFANDYCRRDWKSLRTFGSYRTRRE